MRFVDSNVFIYVLVKSPRDDYVIAKRILQKQAYFDYKLRKYISRYLNFHALSIKSDIPTK